MQVKIFTMVRNEDESGTSGTGEVLEGVVFSTGKVAVCWKSKKTPVYSVSVFDSYQDFERVHIGPHPDNKTEIKWKYIAEKEEQEENEPYPDDELKEMAMG